MDDLDPAVTAWLTRFAAELGVDPPTDSEIQSLLDLAGVAAHSSRRQAAPVACWLSARAGVSPADALRRASKLQAG